MTSTATNELIKSAAEKLKTAGVATSQLDAELLLCHVLDCKRSELQLVDVISAETENEFAKLIEARSQRQPVAYITGIREFYGLELRVNKDILIPRPETEEIVELAIQLIPKQARTIEIGTGSGAIALALKKHRPDLSITATDISTPSLKVAKKNAQLLKVSLSFIECDLLSGLEDEYEVLIANLPYVPDKRRVEKELTHEPGSALFSGQDGLDHYRKLFSQLKIFKQCNLILIEAEPQQKAALQEMAEQAGYLLESHSRFTYCFKKS